MIAISSYRPDAPASIWENQIKAKQTWNLVFTKIIFYGNGDQRLVSNQTLFVPCEGKPKIKEMARLASTQDGWCCLINADIRVDPRAVDLDRVLALHKADCAFSFRIPVGRTQREDLGLDFFAARWFVWRRVWETMPEKFVISKILWDTWLCSFFMRHYRCADVSPARLIYHPDHRDRGDQSMDIRQDTYLKDMRWRTVPVSF